MKEVAAMSDLSTLSLSYTKVTDAGLKELATLKHLTVLDLKGTSATKKGIAEVQRMLPNCEIKGSD